MLKMMMSIDGVVLKEITLNKERTTVGRRPYNDVVIDNLAVSGEHAVLEIQGNEVFLEDLNSTNGTHVNGKSIKRQQLKNGDSIEIGKYTIRFVDEIESEAVDKSMQASRGPAAIAQESLPVATAGEVRGAIRVLSGAAAGREMPLTKVVTTIGKPGVAVAAITRRHHGFVVTHVEGSGNPKLNGSPVGHEPLALQSGDLIELAGTQMQFVLA